jgi:hypothetical protein
MRAWDFAGSVGEASKKGKFVRSINFCETLN